MFQPSSKHPDLPFHSYETWMPWISRRPRNRKHGAKHQRFLDLGEPQRDFPLQPIAAMGMDTDSGCVVFLKFGDSKWIATYWHAIAQRWKYSNRILDRDWHGDGGGRGRFSLTTPCSGEGCLISWYDKTERFDHWVNVELGQPTH